MNRTLTTSLLVICLLSGIGAMARFVAWPVVRVVLPAASAADAEPRLQPRLETDSLANLLVARDPFRVARRPAAVAYDPVQMAHAEAPLPPKPVLTLVGLVAGAEPTALLEGLPGVEGARVVRVGDVIGGLTVRRIANGRVIVVGMDTLWVLTMRRPWN